MAMTCPICEKGELKEQVSLRGIIFKKKVITTYCPICSFEKKKSFKITKQDEEIETSERVGKKISERISTRRGNWKG